MKGRIILFFVIVAGLVTAQEQSAPVPGRHSIFRDLKVGDSLIIYQCYVESFTATPSGGTGNAARTVSEKYVLMKTSGGFTLKSFGCNMHSLPNKRFSGLKIREKEYWQFYFRQQKQLSDKEFAALLALEEKGRETLEYDFAVSKYTSNQVIFKKGADFRQLVYERQWLLSSLFKE